MCAWVGAMKAIKTATAMSFVTWDRSFNKLPWSDGVYQQAHTSPTLPAHFFEALSSFPAQHVDAQKPLDVIKCLCAR